MKLTLLYHRNYFSKLMVRTTKCYLPPSVSVLSVLPSKYSLLPVKKGDILRHCLPMRVWISYLSHTYITRLPKLSLHELTCRCAGAKTEKINITYLKVLYVWRFWCFKKKNNAFSLFKLYSILRGQNSRLRMSIDCRVKNIFKNQSHVHLEIHCSGQFWRID